jgi:hypothetical protein
MLPNPDLLKLAATLATGQRALLQWVAAVEQEAGAQKGDENGRDLPTVRYDEIYRRLNLPVH